MPLITWTEKLSVGVKILDDDHKKLVAMINSLFDGISSGTGKEVLGPTLDELVSYTKTHFVHEEDFFAKSHYPAAAEHKKEHDDLTKQVLKVQEKFKAGAATILTLELMNFLKSWLVTHIQGADMKYKQHLNANGIH